MLTTLKLVLNNIMSTFLETVQVEISQLVDTLIRKLLMVFYMHIKRCKARLKTGTKKKKKTLKFLSVLEEDCQAFVLLGKKAEKLAEAFKYPIASVPLVVATPELTYMAIKKPKVLWRSLLISTVLPRLLFELIISDYLVHSLQEIISPIPFQDYGWFFKFMVTREM